jgi:hypothetical protein
MRIEDMRTRPRRDDNLDDNSNDEPVWGKDENGNMVIKNVVQNKIEKRDNTIEDSNNSWSDLDYDENKFKRKNEFN